MQLAPHLSHVPTCSPKEVRFSSMRTAWPSMRSAPHTSSDNTFSTKLGLCSAASSCSNSCGSKIACSTNTVYILLDCCTPAAAKLCFWRSRVSATSQVQQRICHMCTLTSDSKSASSRTWHIMHLTKAMLHRCIMLCLRSSSANQENPCKIWHIPPLPHNSA